MTSYITLNRTSNSTEMDWSGLSVDEHILLLYIFCLVFMITQVVLCLSSSSNNSLCVGFTLGVKYYWVSAPDKFSKSLFFSVLIYGNAFVYLFRHICVYVLITDPSPIRWERISSFFFFVIFISSVISLCKENLNILFTITISAHKWIFSDLIK